MPEGAGAFATGRVVSTLHDSGTTSFSFSLLTFIRCTFTARNGASIGWKPQYQPEHIFEVAQEEVDLILANLKE